MIDVDLFRKLLDYDPETGALTWRPRPREMFSTDNAFAVWRAQRDGKPAFTADNGAGYRVGLVLGRQYLAHRVAWAIYYGEWPGPIDHINGVRSDNRICNLRAASATLNMRNRKRPTNNTSGALGVSWVASRKKWRAVIKVDGASRFLGHFQSMEEALVARKTADLAFGFHENHGRGQ